LRRPCALQTWVLVMDGSVAGRGGMALRLHVVYKGRALPLAWRVRQGPKGPFPDDLHSALVEVGSGLRPEGAQVVFLGDGAWDGTRLPHTGQDAGWASVGRTGGPRTAWWDGETLRLATLGACSQPGTLVAFSEVGLTRAHYGPIMLSGCWAKGGKAPLYVVTNRDAAEEACRLYSKRCRIETFFSEQKSRGCHLHQSPLSILNASRACSLQRVSLIAGLSIWARCAGKRGGKDYPSSPPL
jgi:hypothetical protein